MAAHVLLLFFCLFWHLLLVLFLPKYFRSLKQRLTLHLERFFCILLLLLSVSRDCSFVFQLYNQSHRNYININIFWPMAQAYF